MVGVEPLARGLQIEVVARHVVPRQFEQQLQIGHLHRIFGHGRVEPLEFLHLLFERLAHLLGPVFLPGLLAQLLDVGIGAVAQLVLDGAHLLLQVVVALLLVDLLLHALLDLVLQFGELLLSDQDLQQFARAGQQTGRLQQRLSVLVRQLQIGADEVDDAAFGIDVLDGEGRLLRHVGRHVDDPERHVADRVDQRAELDALQVGRRIAQRRDAGLEIGFGRDVFADFDLLQTVQDHRQIAVGHLQDLDDAGRRTHLVHVVRRRILHVAFALEHGAQDPALGIDRAHQADALVAAHGDGRDRTRKQNRAAQRQNRHHGGYVDLFDGLVAARHDRNDAMLAVEKLGQRIHVVDLDRLHFIFLTHVSLYK